MSLWREVRKLNISKRGKRDDDKLFTWYRQARVNESEHHSFLHHPSRWAHVVEDWLLKPGFTIFRVNMSDNSSPSLTQPELKNFVARNAPHAFSLGELSPEIMLIIFEKVGLHRWRTNKILPHDSLRKIPKFGSIQSPSSNFNWFHRNSTPSLPPFDIVV